MQIMIGKIKCVLMSILACYICARGRSHHWHIEMLQSELNVHKDLYCFVRMGNDQSRILYQGTKQVENTAYELPHIIGSMIIYQTLIISLKRDIAARFW